MILNKKSTDFWSKNVVTLYKLRLPGINVNIQSDGF
jgi:hypothetical protein